MDSPSWLGILLASIVVVAVSCGVNNAPAGTDASGQGAAWEVPDQLVSGLTPVAETAADDLRADLERNGMAERAPLVGLGRDWWVTITVDLPLDDDQLDAPLQALPAPLDGLRASIGSYSVSALGPPGPIRIEHIDPATAGLRTLLDGSMMPATTVAQGDGSGSTGAWSVTEIRLTAISLPVVAFDAAPSAVEVLAYYGPERIRLGVAQGSTGVTLSEALGGEGSSGDTPSADTPATPSTLPTSTTGAPTTGA